MERGHLGTPLILAFVVVYIRRSRWAWLLLVLFALVFSVLAMTPCRGLFLSR